MKTRIFTAIAALSLAAAAHADTVEAYPGTLSSIVGEMRLNGSTPTRLNVRGDIDIRDLSALAAAQIDTLDLSAASVRDFSSPAQLLYGKHTFEADVIPAYTFAGSPCRVMMLPSATKAVGEGAFTSSSLVRIDIPEGVTLIGDFAFRGCAALEKADIPSTLETLGQGAFTGCESLTGIDLSKTAVTGIGDRTFAGCTHLTRIVMPRNLKHTGTLAFEGTALRSLTASRAVTAAPFSFAGIKQLPSSSIQVSNAGAAHGLYFGDEWLAQVAYPLSPIPDLAYAGCESVSSEDVTLMTGDIGDFAFHSLSTVRIIKLNYGVTSLGEGVLGNTPSLAYIDCRDLLDAIPAVSEHTFDGVDKQKVQVCVTVDNLPLWEAAPYWNEFKLTTELVSVETEKIPDDSFRIYHSAGTLHIESSETLLEVGVYTADGRLIAAAAPGQCSAELPLSAADTQVAVIISRTDNGTRTDKLIISSN